MIPYVKCSDGNWYSYPEIASDSYSILFEQHPVLVIETSYHVDTVIKELPFKVKIIKKIKEVGNLRFYQLALLEPLSEKHLTDHTGFSHKTQGQGCYLDLSK